MAMGARVEAGTEAGGSGGGSGSLGVAGGFEGEKRRTFTGVEGEGLANHVELLAKFPRLMELVSTPWVQVQFKGDSEGDQGDSPSDAEGTTARMGGQVEPPVAASPSAATPVEEANGVKEGGGESVGNGGEDDGEEGIVAVVRLELVMTEYPDLWLQFKEVS